MIMLSAFHMAKFADREPKIERAFYLSVLALGLFLYYSGRAHSFVLMLVVWPVVLIFFFLADQALITSKRRVHFFVYLATLFFVSAPIVVYYSTWFPVIEYIRNGYEPKHIATEALAFSPDLLKLNGLYTLSKRGPGDRLLYYTRVHAPAKKRSSSQPGDLHELNR